MITIENLCKAYNDKILFKNFHLEIPDSRFLVISGESGCGKSTLLNMIGGIETPDKGSIIVNGFDVAKKGKKQKYFKEVVGFLFQNFALLENKTVKENLEIIKKSGRTDISINEALEKVGLQKVINKKVYQLSGGEQQRVALARLMLKKCSIVLADEPTASCIYTQKGNKKIRKPQAANQTALIFDRRAAARLLSINSIRRLCWS